MHRTMALKEVITRNAESRFESAMKDDPVLKERLTKRDKKFGKEAVVEEEKKD